MESCCSSLWGREEAVFGVAGVASGAAGKVSRGDFSRGSGSGGSRFPSSPQPEQAKAAC